MLKDLVDQFFVVFWIGVICLVLLFGLYVFAVGNYCGWDEVIQRFQGIHNHAACPV